MILENLDNLMLNNLAKKNRAPTNLLDKRKNKRQQIDSVLNAWTKQLLFKVKNSDKNYLTRNLNSNLKKNRFLPIMEQQETRNVEKYTQQKPKHQSKRKRLFFLFPPPHSNMNFMV